MKKKCVCAALLFAASIAPASAGEVGFTRLNINDPMGGTMRVSLWYPTDKPTGTVTVGPFTFPATRDIEPKQGKFGLVTISHGSAGSDLGHRNVAVALARSGLVVAAPLHPRNNYEDNSGVGRRVVMEGRPLQMSAVVDALLSHSVWRARIDVTRIGAFGFSLGGYTVLAVLGAKPDMANIIRHCETTTADPFCNFAKNRMGTVRKQIEREYQKAMTDVSDTRFCAASIADPVAVPFSNEALAAIKARHIQVWRPEEQDMLLADAHANRIVRHLNSRSNAEKTVQLTVPGARHYSFLAPFPPELQAALPLVLTTDSPGFDRTKFQSKFANKVADFLSKSLEQCAAQN